ncbi:reverse transcriptase domain-containing protein [Trichonephila clavipes]|nr:reverse transcriptase domain-containing protein [Trichonephila clavipes]
MKSNFCGRCHDSTKTDATWMPKIQEEDKKGTGRPKVQRQAAWDERYVPFSNNRFRASIQWRTQGGWWRSTKNGFYGNQLQGEAGRVIGRIDRQNSRFRTATTIIIKFGYHASFVESESAKNAVNEVEVQPPGGYGTFFSMNGAILSDSDNVTAFGVADASRVEVRAHGEKYATRTLNILQLNINGTQRKIEELTEILNANKQEVTIINACHPDNSDINLDLLNTLLDTKSDTKILLGDLNAKSPSWGSRTLDLKGSQIEDLLCDNDLSILKDKRSTYLSKTNGTTSALDITAINHQTASQATWKILKSAISDHFPIITSINQRVDGTIQNKRSWNFRKANWGKFTSELETLCSLSSPHALDERLQSFASHINAAAKRSILRVKRRNDWVPFWKDTNIENLINERDKLSTELQKNNTETNRIRSTNLCHEVEDVISFCKRKKWTEFCETLDLPKISQHWKVIKTLNNQSTHQEADLLTNIISSSGRDAATNKETASLLAKHYENKSKLSFNANDRKLLRTYRKTIQDSKRYNHKNIFTIQFLMEELEAVIAKMNPGKAPGPDVIFGRMVQHFGNLAKTELLEIFNLSWDTGKSPKI